MRILTIGSSPYLLNRNGRINRDIIRLAQKKGHHVESVVWHHDVQYFMPNQIGQHQFEGTAIHPFLGEKGALPPFVFEVMKVAQPQVVVTIGEYEDVDWLSTIKSIYPHLFKWIAFIPSGTQTVNERNRLSLAYADQIVVTSKTALNAFRDVKAPSRYVAYPPSPETFKTLNKPLPDGLSLLCMGKNAQIANVPAFFKAVSLCPDVRGTLHTNIDDGGDYDLRCLIKRYGLQERLSLPTKYVSVKEGLSDELVNELYNSHHAIVDCSLQSATGLTTLEAMSTGCIPIGMEIGAMADVLAEMPLEFRFSVPFETFMGPKEENLAIISVKELAKSIEYIRRCSHTDPRWIGEARRLAMVTSSKFEKETFVQSISDLLETIVTCDNSVAVDTF